MLGYSPASMNRRLAILALVLAGFVAGGTASAAAPTTIPPLAVAKTCSSGWKHAIIAGEHKCLRAGQFCTRRYDTQYHRYGYHCHRYDASVGRYRLTR